MTSFAKNWWRKHDMDKDAKGCFAAAIAFVIFVFAAGGTIMGLIVWSAMR